MHYMHYMHLQSLYLDSIVEFMHRRQKLSISALPSQCKLVSVLKFPPAKSLFPPVPGYNRN